MSTICCLNMPTNHHSLTSPLFQTNSNQKNGETTEEENYCFILNQHSSSITHSNKLSMSTRCLQQQQQQHSMIVVNKESEVLETENQFDHDKLLLPRSTRSLKRRTSLLEKSRDWVNVFYYCH